MMAAQVQTWLARLGVWPALAVCAAAVTLGVLWLNGLVNALWVVPPDHPAFLEMQRAVATGTVNSTALLEASDWRLLALFLAAVTLVGLGLSLPLLYYANRSVRLRRKLAMVSFWTLLRQALWAGLWLAFGVWLQMQRTFGIPIILMLGVVFVLLELLFLLRWRSAATAAGDLKRSA